MAESEYIFNREYKCFKITLKSASYDKSNRVSLCQNETQKVYNFDKITRKICSSKSSCDALWIDESRKKIYCIEFKNSKYSEIKTAVIKKKVEDTQSILTNLFTKHNLTIKKYQFIFFVVYKPQKPKYRRFGKLETQFELENHKGSGKFWEDIQTNDTDYFTDLYKKTI